MEDFIIKHSKLGGNGLFTTKSFGKNTVLMRLDGIKLTKKEVFNLPIVEAENLLQIGENLYLDFTGKGHFFLNHNCSPNAFVRVYVNTAFLMSAIPIKAGDEIVIDFSLTSLENTDEWSMDCKCNFIHCRKKISGWNSLSDERKERYKQLGLVPEYVLKSE